ncbi:hypothetical protein ACPOL_6466 [Acidisarcina polymorpha]|uniref:Uncharacterized protein n=1 Tax=Acidisarcina polymorpha TaxID=2211140 RepID=A0A2Z5G8T7_9BACT|nr:hypothetical protein ACPOL_6466 [Acidisarcina polymorpha]
MHRESDVSTESKGFPKPGYGFAAQRAWKTEERLLHKQPQRRQ